MKKGKRAARGKGLALLGFLLFSAGVLFLAWVRISALDLRYEISRLRAERVRLLQRNRELRLERAALTSAEELQRRAQEELLLRRPRKGEVVILR